MKTGVYRQWRIIHTANVFFVEGYLFDHQNSAIIEGHFARTRVKTIVDCVVTGTDGCVYWLAPCPDIEIV